MQGTTSSLSIKVSVIKHTRDQMPTSNSVSATADHKQSYIKTDLKRKNDKTTLHNREVKQIKSDYDSDILSGIWNETNIHLLGQVLNDSDIRKNQESYSAAMNSVKQAFTDKKITFNDIKKTDLVKINAFFNGSKEKLVDNVFSHLRQQSINGNLIEDPKNVLHESELDKLTNKILNLLKQEQDEITPDQINKKLVIIIETSVREHVLINALNEDEKTRQNLANTLNKNNQHNLQEESQIQYKEKLKEYFSNLAKITVDNTFIKLVDAVIKSITIKLDASDCKNLSVMKKRLIYILKELHNIMSDQLIKHAYSILKSKAIKRENNTQLT